MHNIIKITAAAVCLTLISGCTKRVKVEMIDKSYSSDTITANVLVPQLKLPGEELQRTVNEEFSATTDELLKKFEEGAKKTGEQSVFDMQTTEYFNRDGFLSLVTDYRYFARKTHKNSFRIAKNIDTVNGIEVSLSDIFCDEAYIDALNSLLEDSVADNKEKYTDLWAKPKLRQNQGFYIDGENLVLFYPPYELSYYERGFVEIPIQIGEVLTYMCDNYREIFSN